MIVAFTILGQPVSMKNRRQNVTIHRGTASERQLWVMSPEAKAYEKATLQQIPPIARVRMEGPVKATIRMFYASERSDMDESLLLDCLQDRWKRAQGTGERVLIQSGVYRNDRQVRHRDVQHFIDARNPRAEVTIEPRELQQIDMQLVPAPAHDDDPLGPPEPQRRPARATARPPALPPVTDTTTPGADDAFDAI